MVSKRVLMKTLSIKKIGLSCIAAGLLVFAGLTAKSQAQTAGDVQVTIAEFLDMDFADIQAATNGGRDD
ncbi:MAG: hypothetical protein VX704_09095, partial [Verrucomicrobiota bacterium]|nr:hypothetical protein [Verrucomicrobiota bacterium]